MNSVKLSVLVLVAAWLVGCVPPAPAPSRDAASVKTWDGLVVTLEVPKRDFHAGEQFAATVVARNDGENPITISARTGTQAYVRLMHHELVGWGEVRRYPQTSLLLAQTWTLEPKEERRMVLNLTVEPDWPTGVPLRLVGFVNGRPEAAPAVTVSVAGAPKASAAVSGAASGQKTSAGSK
jgi:hypothetical protein